MVGIAMHALEAEWQEEARSATVLGAAPILARRLANHQKQMITMEFGLEY